MTQKFNIRVYGIVTSDDQKLLVSDELVKGICFTKFPGGGLEWGEGTEACLHREFEEEMSQPIEIIDHFYTTSFFQASAFNENDQLISIYYRVKLIGEIQFKTKSRAFDFPDDQGNRFEVQRWIPLSELSPSDFKWPVDKEVVRLILKTF